MPGAGNLYIVNGTWYIKRLGKGFMANLNGILRKMSGSVGNLTFRQSNGVTVVSEKVTKVHNPRSDAQMRTRTKFSNIVAMYKGIRPKLNRGFESKAAGLSDFNMFVRMNMQKEPVYLTKQQVAEGACVAAPYQITQGSIPAIVITGTGQNGKTDIRLGGLSITSSTTVAQFAQAVVNNNPEYQYGDQISFFIVRQKTNAETGVPYCLFEAAKVTLDAASEDTMNDVVGTSTGFKAVDGNLGHSGSDGDCAYTWVHSRKSNGKLLVSSQSLLNANSIITDYQGENAYTLARTSYGITQDVFLSPDAESAGTSANAGGGDDNGGGGGGGL